MRVTMTMLRAGGRLLPQGSGHPMRGTLATRKFQGGDTWFKVLDFQPLGYPGQHKLCDPRLKGCEAETTLIVFSGPAQEDGAWVVQEWAVDMAPSEEAPWAGAGSSRRGGASARPSPMGSKNRVGRSSVIAYEPMPLAETRPFGCRLYLCCVESLR